MKIFRCLWRKEGIQHLLQGPRRLFDDPYLRLKHPAQA